nr:hypothetical protein [Tanacetum cinerariifolium]
MVNRTNVDYVALMWWNFMNNVFQKKEAIQNPRFIKLIIADLMKRFPNIPKRIKEDIILSRIMISKIRETNDFKEYEMVFMKMDVPMEQPQPVVSTQGMHRSTPRAIRHQKVVKRDHNDDESDDRLEPESHKENPKIVDDDDDKVEKRDDDLDSLEIRTKETCVTKDVQASKGVSQLAKKATEDLIESTLKPCIAATIIEDRDAFRFEVPDLVSHEFNTQAPKIIEDLFKNYVKSNVIQVHPTTTTFTETISSADLQQQLYTKMKRSLQDQANDLALWEGWVRVGGNVLISLSDLIFTNCNVLSQSRCSFVSDLVVHDFGAIINSKFSDPSGNAKIDALHGLHIID